MLVRMTRLVYKANSGKAYEPAPWGDEGVNLAFITRVQEEVVEVKRPAPGMSGPTTTLLVYSQGETEPRRYVGSLKNLMALQVKLLTAQAKLTAVAQALLD